MPDHASWPRRILAFVVDGVVCTLASIAILGLPAYTDPAGPGRWWVLGLFFLEVTVLTALVGGSFGQLATGIRVTRTDGRRPDLLRTALRTLLILLLIPPLVFTPATGRGLHDLWTDTGAYEKDARATPAA